MILLDYNQVCLSAILPFSKDLKKSEDEVRNLVRHIILSNILTYKKKYGSEYGNVIICCDGREYWRKEVFPYYKGSRKKSRDNSDLNWKLIFDVLSEMRQDLIDYFPYKVININRAEADDIIAILAEWSQNNELIQEGMFEEPQKMMIISSDGDFLQLQKYNNVSQWSPNTKKLLKMSHRDLHEKYITHIVKGDSGDGVPGILGDDDTIITEGKRTPRMSAKRLAEFIDQGKKACQNDTEIRNWDRNEQLISFNFIPIDIKESIIKEFVLSKPKRDSMKLMNYLMKHRCNLLLSELGNF
jgi:5'-3' exonuclease